MRRRFGRGRRNRGREDSSREAIDAGHWLEKLSSEPGFDVSGLAVLDPSPVPAESAVLARGQDASGAEVVVAFSPRSGADALLAGLGFMQMQGGGGTLRVVAPSWSSFARELLSKLGAQAFTLQSTELPSLREEAGIALAETPDPHYPLPPGHMAALVAPEREQLLARCLQGLQGLAAKHGGSLQSWAGHVDLVLQAERVASLSVSAGALRLETLRPDRGQIPLEDASLASALDRLEGSLRKYLNDKQVRTGEGALRGALWRILARAADASTLRLWPPAGERQVLDLAGVDGEGRNFVATARERFGLIDLAQVLEAAWRVQRAWPLVLAGEDRLRVDPPDLLLAARNFDEVALAALAGLEQRVRLFDLETARGDRHGLSPRSDWVSTVPVTAAEATAEPVPEPAAPPQRAGEDLRTRPPRSRSRRRPQAKEEDGIEEVSLFDLDDGDESGEESARRGSSRRRGRRRGGRGRSAREDRAEDTPADATSPEAVEEDAPVEAEVDVVVTDDDEIFALAQDAPDPDASETVPYEEEEEGAPEEDAAVEFVPTSTYLEAAEAPAHRPQRKRTAFVVCAERNAILSAVLLARDIRLVEGFWIYPQAELMTFFRNVATDLREETPICVIGFTGAPSARDSIQAASLYRERIDWFDHHDWPPEDLSALREALGEERVHVSGGLESPLPLVLSHGSRRSRFSDRLVDLGVGRFTLHDYERWGRVWWHRLGEFAERRGAQRAAVDPLLAGRPSDLSREAGRVPPPPPPPEAEFVASRDFRLVHFSGYTLVVLDVPRELDLHLAARVARERYDAQLSLAGVEGEELLVLAGDEGPGHRGFDLPGMVDHLSVKYAWIEALPAEDRVARLRVQRLREEDGRLDEVVTEIAMGRSIVEA